MAPFALFGGSGLPYSGLPCLGSLYSGEHSLGSGWGGLLSTCDGSGSAGLG